MFVHHVSIIGGALQKGIWIISNFMGNTLDRKVETAEEKLSLSLQELMALDGFRGVDSVLIFGDKPERDRDAGRRMLGSYAGISSALRGCPLDSWVRHGMHRNRRPEFSNFSGLTEGFSREEKVRMVVILQQYLKDILKRSDDFQDERFMFEGETLGRAQLWVMDMLNGIDEATIAACVEFGVHGFNPLAPATGDTIAESSSVSEAVEPVRAKVGGVLTLFLRNLFGRK